MPIFLGAFITAFKMWMVFDALQRRSGNNNWYFIIIVVPFGEWIYFFSVKAKDPQFKQLFRRLGMRRTSLEQLRYAAEHCASQQNRLRLAKGLFDHERYEEALQTAELLLAGDAKEKEALYVKARSLLKLGRDDEGIATLTGLFERDAQFHEGEAAHILAECLSRQERHEDAVRVLERVIKGNNRMRNAVALARELSYAHRFEEAQKVIEKSIEDARFAPAFVKRQDRREFREAESLLRRLKAARSNSESPSNAIS